MVDESEFTARLAAYIHATHNAFSDNTERAFRADLAVFRNWCGARCTTAFPASPEIIADFIDDMAASRAPATVRRYVASIAVAQRAIGSDGKLVSPLVKLALQRLHRRRGRRQKQALGLTWSLRQRLLDASGNRLIDARNRALLAVAYDAMLRRSELSAARVADLVLDIHGGATLLVRRGKTDADGRSATLYLARDPASLLTDWLRRSGVADGRMFRSLSKGGAVGDRAARHPAGRPLEDDRHAEPIWRAPPSTAQRRRAARPPAGARVTTVASAGGADRAEARWTYPLNPINAARRCGPLPRRRPIWLRHENAFHPIAFARRIPATIMRCVGTAEVQTLYFEGLKQVTDSALRREKGLRPGLGRDGIE